MVCPYDFPFRLTLSADKATKNHPENGYLENFLLWEEINMLNRHSFVAAILALPLLAMGGNVGADDDYDDDYDVEEFSKDLRKAVQLKKLRRHQAVFQFIAHVTDGTRFSGTRGYSLSAIYVALWMKHAGYNVDVQEFEFLSFRQLGPSTLEQTTPDSLVYEEHTDYFLGSYSVSGEVTGRVTAVDIDTAPNNASTSGCEPEDFAEFPPGDIALIQRGACSFQRKAENAAAAGAVGVIIFNQGNTEDRKDLIEGALSAEYMGGIPVFYVSFDRGVEWAGTDGLELRMVADSIREVAKTSNVIAETKQGDPSSVVVVGAHLDSVTAGPGIQDNGSGSAAILEIALQLARKFDVNDRDADDDTGIRNKLRFAWWGAEESGLLGSDFYVRELSDTARANIALYLNFDMIGSPNFGRFIYDGDGSAFGLQGPPGSDAIESEFENYFDGQGLASEPTETDFRSDYAAFFDADIPFGGLFTGADGIKTAEQVLLYGGTAGEQYDPCYHLACDTFENISLEAFDQMSDAAAHAVITWAVSDLETNLAPVAAPPALGAVEQAVEDEHLGNFIVK
jgi:Zn-dependent M28 family amino/carboxypeptidase